MFDHVHHHRRTHHATTCAACAPLRQFTETHREALLNAGSLLCGRKGEALALSVLDGLSGEPTPVRHLRRRLGNLIDLLRLEHVHDEDRLEAGYFAKIEPWDPVVEELCLLADGLEAAIREWDILHKNADISDVDQKSAA